MPLYTDTPAGDELATQCAAVTTQSTLIREPPHRVFPAEMDTCHGTCEMEIAEPPTIRGAIAVAEGAGTVSARTPARNTPRIRTVSLCPAAHRYSVVTEAPLPSTTIPPGLTVYLDRSCSRSTPI